MTNSYFKVTDEAEVFFFDIHTKETVTTAWKKAYAQAEVYLATKSKIKDVPVDYFISTWKKPLEFGPWSTISVIGENNMNLVMLSSYAN
jgi:hypothetical protein